MDKAKVKKIFCTSYRIIELIVVLFVTYCVVMIGISHECYDRVNYTDAWDTVLFALVWMFFVSLPLLLIYIVSFFRSLSFRTILHKIIFGGHILNIALWFLFYFILPKPEPITATMMEKHYLSHELEMRDLINYTRSCLDDSTGIDLLMRNGDIIHLFVNRLGGIGDLFNMENENQRDSVLNVAGITPEEFDTIQTKMKSVDIIGIKIFRNGYVASSTLSYGWYGSSNYQFILYDSKQSYKEHPKHDELWLNDSVAIEYMHNLTGYTFPDRDEFIKKHPQK